jgi:CRP/FNR family transcriptional regulator
MKEILKQIYLFKALEDEELDALGKISSIARYDKDALLFMKGDISKHLMILIEGDVTVYKHDEKGNEIVIGIFSPYALLAEPATLRHTPLPSSAMFKSQGAVIKIELAAFERSFLSNAHVASEIIQSLLGKIELLQQNIHLNIATTAKQKVLHLYETNASIVSKLKKYEVAALLGMTAETFSRTVKQLVKEEQLLKTDTGYMTL